MRIDKRKLYVFGDSDSLTTMAIPVKQCVLCRSLEEYLELSADDSLYTVSLFVNAQFIIPHSLWLALDNIELNRNRIIVFPVRDAISHFQNGMFTQYKRAPWEGFPVDNPSELVAPTALMAYSPILRHILSDGWIKAPEYASEYEVIPYPNDGVYRADESLYSLANEKEDLFDFLQTLSNDIVSINENKDDFSKIGIIVQNITDDNQKKHFDRKIQNPQVIREEKIDLDAPDFSGYFRTNSREIRALHKEHTETSNMKELEIPDEVAYNRRKRSPRGFTSH